MQSKHRTWGYRRASDGSVEAHLFEDGLPAGWADSPARVDASHSDPRNTRPLGEPSPGRKRRTSGQVDLDEALAARAGELGINFPEGVTVSDAEAIIAEGLK